MQSPSRQYQTHVTPVRKLLSPTCLGPSFFRAFPHQSARYDPEELDEDIMAGELMELMNLASAAIQACWRGYCTRKQLVIEQGAATLLQAFWRGYCVRRDLRAQVTQSPEAVPPANPTEAKAFSLEGQPREQLASSDQNHCRRCWARDWLAQWKRGRLKAKSAGLGRGRTVDQRLAAATVIQSYWRGFVARRHVALQHIAATVIQSHYRGHLTRLWIRSRLRFHLHPSSTSRAADPPPSSAPSCPVSEPRNPELCSPGDSVNQARPPGPLAARRRPKGPFAAGLSEAPRPPIPMVARPIPIVQHTGGQSQFRFGERFLLEKEPDTSTAACSPECRGCHPPTPARDMKPTDIKPRDNGYRGPQAEPRSIGDIQGTGDECLERLRKQEKELGHRCNKDEECQECLSPNCPRFIFTANKLAVARQAAPELPHQPRSQAAKRVSEYMLFSSPNNPDGSRKLIRFRESPCFGQSKDPEGSLSELDFNLSDLEVPRDANSYPSKPSLRKSIKRAREENEAAKVIQATWKGHLARKLLRRQTEAAVRIQAMYRSYRTRREFQNFGIYPLFSKPNHKDFKKVEVRKDGPRLGVFCCEPLAVRQLPYQHLPVGSIALGHEGPLPSVRELPIAIQTASLPGRALEGTPVTSRFLPQTGNPSLAPTGRNQKMASQDKHLDTSLAMDNWPRKRSFQTRRQHWEKERAASVIQAAWRGHKARTAITRQERAATNIQALFRGFQMRKILKGLGRELEESAEAAKAVSWENTAHLGLRGNQKNRYMNQHPSCATSPVGRVLSQDRSPRSVWKTNVKENQARYDQVKSTGCGIFVKRNPCYNPRKVTIHVKAATGDVG